MIHVPMLNEIKDLEENSLDSSNKILLLGSQTNILENLINLFKKLRPRLIFLDFSIYYQSAKFELREELEEIVLKKKFRELKQVTDEFWKKSEKLINSCRLVLDEKGFIAIKVNGTIKSSLKSKLDIIFGSNHFVNEIIIDSPYKVWYAPNSTVFERTNYVLLYSQNLNPRINPVLNEKESGGYWHSFVSKGQGTPKKFVFKDKGELILAPPLGTHWKLKQETILDLCAKGQIRLNKKGNPEYWVPRKKGQIIDSNWLDIQSFEHIFNHLTNSVDFYKRLFNICLKKQDLFLDLSANLGVSLTVADQLNLEWIGVEEEKYAYQLMMRFITNSGINFSAYNCESLPVSPVVFYPQSSDFGINDSYSANKSSIKLIERYRGQNPIVIEGKSNEWTNMLILGDVFDVLPCITKQLRKKLKLIYIDPPFFTGSNEKIVIPIGSSEEDGLQTGGSVDYPVEDLAYENILDIPNPIKFFMEWFKKRVLLMKSLLRDDGHIFVRFDYHFGHYAKKVLDEVFGVQNFVIEILVRRMKKNLSLKQAYNQTHLIIHSDSIFVYQGSEKARVNSLAIKKRKRKGQNLAERQYPNDNLWIDVAGYEKMKKTLYPTENSESLLSRVIKTSTEKGDLIADFFCGSGTTLAVAEKLERNWIGVDIGHYSIHEIKKRLLRIPNNNPFDIFNIISSHQPGQTSSPVITLDIEVDESKLKITIVDFILKKRLPETRTHNFIDYIDYWAVDWNHQNEIFEPKWYSYREMRGKKVLRNIQPSITHEYSTPGKYLVTVAVYDVFGNSTRHSLPINIK